MPRNKFGTNEYLRFLSESHPDAVKLGGRKEDGLQSMPMLHVHVWVGDCQVVYTWYVNQ